MIYLFFLSITVHIKFSFSGRDITESHSQQHAVDISKAENGRSNSTVVDENQKSDAKTLDDIPPPAVHISRYVRLKHPVKNYFKLDS